MNIMYCPALYSKLYKDSARQITIGLLIQLFVNEILDKSLAPSPY